MAADVSGMIVKHALLEHVHIKKGNNGFNLASMLSRFINNIDEIESGANDLGKKRSLTSCGSI